MKALLFVLLYGSGFVGVLLGFPYANVPSFLLVRTLLVIVIMGVVAVLIKAPWPKTWREVGHIMVAGFLLLGVFSIMCWTGLEMGLSPGVSALIIGLQPLLVGLISYWFMHRSISRLQWLGIVIGLMGTLLIVLHQLHGTHSAIMLGVTFISLLGLTFGNLYQKRFCAEMNIVTGSVIQSIAGSLFALIFLPFFGGFHVEWRSHFIIAVLWMALLVSIGGLSLLYALLRQGEVYKVASLFYLMPLMAAAMAYAMFGTTLTTVQLFGMALVLGGVILVNLKRQRA